MVMVCAVCEARGAAMNRLGGLDVCDSCLGGGASASASRRGWSLGAETRLVTTQDRSLHVTTVVGRLDEAPPIRATFRLREGIWRALSWFHGVKAAEPLFDRTVFVTSPTAAATARLLADEGAQSALMDLVGEGARVDVDGASVDVVIRRPDPPDVARLTAEVAVLMAHLRAFAEAQL